MRRDDSATTLLAMREDARIEESSPLSVSLALSLSLSLNTKLPYRARERASKRARCITRGKKTKPVPLAPRLRVVVPLAGILTDMHNTTSNQD